MSQSPSAQPLKARLTVWKLRGKLFLSLDRETQKRLLKERIGAKAVGWFRRQRESYFTLRRNFGWKFLGPKTASSLLWSEPAHYLGWPKIENYLMLLNSTHPEIVPHFVTLAFEKSLNPAITYGLASHPFARAHVQNFLERERLKQNPKVTRNIGLSEGYAAGFLVATALTGDDAAIEHAYARMAEKKSRRFSDLVKSFGQRMETSAAETMVMGLSRNGLRQAVRHRLIISENCTAPKDFLPLLSGAEKVTVIGLNDTFGKGDFAWLSDYPSVGQVKVEHIRSRITRFCSEYVDLHLKTKEAAKKICDEGEVFRPLMQEDERPYLEVVIADYLFFQALKIVALGKLLKDNDFDHIVIATRKHQRASSFLALLSGVEGLDEDERVEMIAISDRSIDRQRARECFKAVKEGPRPVTPTEIPVTPEMLADFDEIAQNATTHLKDGDANADKSRVLFFTTNNSAYNKSNGRYIVALADNYDCNILFYSRNANELSNALTREDGSRVDAPIQFLRADFKDGVGGVESNIRRHLVKFANAQPKGDIVACAVKCQPQRLAGSVIQSHLLHCRAMNIWFDRMDAAQNLPRLAIVSPARVEHLAAIFAIARRHGVPSLALEAHGLNANYSRYIKIMADYYGVISTLFKKEAVTGFGIPADRVSIVGTPRIIAPKQRDFDPEMVQARAGITENVGFDFSSYRGVLTFFGQPSGWEHVEKIWRSILTAAGENNAAIILKPHPEETASRVDLYMGIAEEMGQKARVGLVFGNPDQAIKASDIVLTAYSAAALDAAVLRVPVICVTEGDKNYPVDQHLIVGAPLVRSARELSEKLSDYFAAPEVWRENAERFLVNEPQFAEGPDQRLRELVAQIIEENPYGPRTENDLPKDIFLDPPHPTFSV